MINWTESQETAEKYWSLKGEGFTIIKKPNAFELHYDTNVDGTIVSTTHRSISLECLKKLASIEWAAARTINQGQ